MNTSMSGTLSTIVSGDHGTRRSDGAALPLRVLVIGRRNAAASLVWEALKAWRPRLDRALDVDVARDLVARARYDLIVALLPIPGVDAATLRHHLRVYDERVPLCALAAVGAMDAVEGIDAGVDVYLVEPLHVEELRARLAALLRRHINVQQRVTSAPTTQPDVSALTPGAVASRRPRPGRLAALWGDSRGTLTRALAVATLLGTGVLGDRALAAPRPAAVAATNASTPAAPAAVSSSATGADAAQYAFALASPSVVYVNNVGVGSGSGVIYDTRGDIVTNAHVVAGAQKVTVTLSSGKTYAATIVGTDTADDLAVIHIGATGLTPARFAPAGSYMVAQTALAIGSPLGLRQSVTAGLISALGRTVQEPNSAYLPNAIQTSAPINPGNSGGALVTLNGTVVGIPTLQATEPQNNNGGAAQGIGFAVPSTRVTYIAHQLIATGTVAHTGRADLGVATVDAQQAAGAPGVVGPGGQGSPSASSVSGALVQAVSGPAAQAGVLPGDVITALNGGAITSMNDLLTALAQQKPGAPVTVTVDRAGSVSAIHVTLGELPANPS